MKRGGDGSDCPPAKPTQRSLLPARTGYAAMRHSRQVTTLSPPEELSTFRRAATLLNADHTLVASLDNQLQRAQAIGNVRASNLPRVSADGLHLPTDEHCYLNSPAIRVRHLKSGTRQTYGQLVVTNRKVRFIVLSPKPTAA